MATISKLKKKLDKIFSEYIRLRDCDYKGNCKCISCGKEAPALAVLSMLGIYLAEDIQLQDMMKRMLMPNVIIVIPS